MHLVTRMELNDLNDIELAILLTVISQELAKAVPGSVEWQTARLSLDNIRHEQQKRCTVVRPKPSRGPRC